MNRFCSILITLYLVATHAVAAPVHLVIEHGHPASAEGVLHAHGPESEDHDHHHDHDSEIVVYPEGEVSLRDASDFGDPHRHDSHAHSATDHGFIVVRADFSQYLPLPLLPDFEKAPLLPVEAPVAATESPPQNPTAQRSTPHRGPPVG